MCAYETCFGVHDAGCVDLAHLSESVVAGESRRAGAAFIQGGLGGFSRLVYYYSRLRSLPASGWEAGFWAIELRMVVLVLDAGVDLGAKEAVQEFGESRSYMP